MNTVTLLIVTLLCLSMVNGRSFDERTEQDSPSETENEGIRARTSQMRHRKRRWQSNYGYEYPGPIPAFYPERREYEYQQDLLPKILRLLEEISAYVRRPQPPPPPPQPIYIPYPVPYPVPQYNIPACTPSTKKPNVTSRFPEMEDTNQNWGFVIKEEKNEDVGDGSRPISFDPIKPIRPMKRPAPNVEHGSSQLDSQQTTQAPRFENERTAQIPHMCKAAIVSCCAGKNQKQCFNNFGCGVTYNDGKACSNESIKEALEALRLAYSPVS